MVPIGISLIDYFNKEHTKAWVPGRSVEVITSKVNHYIKLFLSLVFSSFMTYHGVNDYGSTTGTTNGAGTAYPSEYRSSLPVFGVRVAQSLVFCV